ncbi:MAG TPA: hypothetical protein VFZ59_18725 [Verrucomicrobiae bacterium]|nr:hypothetical protein [Verrucomicrobiae bacterium]
MNTSFALGSLIAFIAVSATGQDYAIKMQQPLKVGQRYKFTAVASEASDNSMTSGSRVLKEEKEELSVEMESEVTVLAVDAKGRATKQSHRIIKLLQGAEKKPVLAAGTKVIASRSDQKKEFEIGGAPAPVAVAKVLNLAVEITPGGPTDDEIFGTKERKKVGDQWPLNEALALQGAKEILAASGATVRSVKGTTTLQKVTNEGGVEIIHLVGNVTTTLSPAPKGQFTFTDSTMNASFSGAFPSDFSKSARKEGETMSLEFKASGKPNPTGPMVQISAKSKQSATRQYKLLD